MICKNCGEAKDGLSDRGLCLDGCDHLNGYVCFYNGKRIEVYASHLLEAKQKALDELKPPQVEAPHGIGGPGGEGWGARHPSRRRAAVIKEHTGITDHDLARALRECGWRGAVSHNGVTGVSTFMDNEGKVLATVVYDNQQSIKKAVFMPEFHKRKRVKTLEVAK